MTREFALGQPAVLSKSYNLEPVNSTSGGDSPCYKAAETEHPSPSQFQSRFTGCMELYADPQTVSRYLDAHHNWFCRCARPMKVKFLGDNGYNLAIGRFGAFGYNVEPSIGLELLPQDQGIYRIRTIPVPEQEPQAYQVDFQSELRLVEVPTEVQQVELTQVEWHLELSVMIQFPKFIHKLPQRLIQQTGDRLLAQIVRQVSRRLTAKVQEDFHTSHGLSVPRHCRKQS